MSWIASKDPDAKRRGAIRLQIYAETLAKKAQPSDSEGQFGTEPESTLPTIVPSQCRDSNFPKELP